MPTTTTTRPLAKHRFHAARDRYLEDQSAQGRETNRTRLLLLAELVAKITYHQTSPWNPFDSDTGWYIAPAALDLAIRLDLPALSGRVRAAIDAQPGYD